MTRRAFAQEDINLGTNSVEISRTRKYVDIDLTLSAKPTSKDIYKKNDAAAVKQAVKNLIMTNRLEKPFRPNFGGNIRSALFELADYGENFILTDQIASTIQRNEPRANGIGRPNNIWKSISPIIQFMDRKSNCKRINFQ